MNLTRRPGIFSAFLVEYFGGSTNSLEDSSTSNSSSAILDTISN